MCVFCSASYDLVYSTKLLIGKIKCREIGDPGGKLSGGLFTVSLKAMRRMHRTPKALPRTRRTGSAKSGLIYLGEAVGVPPASTSLCAVRRGQLASPVCQAFCEFA
jgi:hypothetical protein